MIRIALALTLLATLAACSQPDSMSFAPSVHPMADFNTAPVPAARY